MTIPLRVLIVDDSEDDALLMLSELRSGGYDPTFQRVQTREEMADALAAETWDIVLADYLIPRFNGPAVLMFLKAEKPDMPFVLISGRVGDETAADVVRAGADDYVLKDKMERLVPAVRDALRQGEIRRSLKPSTAIPLRVLIVEDSPDDALLVINEMEKGGYAVEFVRVETAEEMGSALQTGSWDIIISDYLIPGFGGGQALEILKESGLDVPFVLVSGKIGEQKATAIMKAGACDFVSKDHLARLAPAVDREIREVQVRRRHRWAEESLQKLIEHLDSRVKERTLELARVIEELKVEIESRKNAEESVRHTSQILASVIEASPSAIISLDSDYNVQMWNPGAERIFQRTAEEVMHRPASFVPASEESKFRSLVERVLTGETVFSRDQIRQRKDGSLVDVNVSVGPLIGPDGRVTGAVAVVEDISRRKEAEERRDLLAAVVEQSSESIFILDPQYRIQYVNAAFEKSSGKSRQDLMGGTPALLYNRAQEQGLYQTIIYTLDLGQTWMGRITSEKKDGKSCYEDLTVFPIRDSSCNIINFVGVGRDVTQRVSLEEQLRQAQKMEAIGTLAGGIAHDFNNVLQVALGYSDMLLVGKGKGTKEFEALEAILHSAQRGADLVKQILAFSRKLETNLRLINPNREVEQARKLLFRIIPKMIGIELRLAENLNNVMADSNQIEQILLNLVLNAKDAMPETGGSIVIETRNVILDEAYCSVHVGIQQGDYVLLAISDTGCGMEKEVMDRIFEPFFTTKKVGEGTGLGLAMVFGIVKSHEGHIDCYSEPGVGTTFSIYLPASRREQDTDVCTVTQKPAIGTETILLVDDDESIRDLGEKMLTHAGYRVLTAENGQEALKIFRVQKDKIAVVVLDLVMPKMGGKECLEKLLEIDPNVKVLIASGILRDWVAEGTSEPGARGFVQKPYDIQKLLNAVRDVLDTGGGLCNV